MTLHLAPTTFGTTPAAQRLAEEMNAKGNAFLSRKVSRLLCDMQEGFGDLVKTPNSKTRHKVMRWWLAHHLEQVSAQIAPDFEQAGMQVSFLENVMHRHFRIAMRDGDVWDRLAN